MLIIGESLNSTIEAVGQAVIRRDEDFIGELALRQVSGGAHKLDLNAGGLAQRDEVEDLVWMVETVQKHVSVPLMLDSPDPQALREAAMVCRGERPILSSVTAEEEKMATLIPLAVELDCPLVCLCMGDNGIPRTPENRLVVAQTLVQRATNAGIKPDNLYLDPLAMSVAADSQAGNTTLKTIQLILGRFSDVHILAGVSNVSFGLPLRRLLNRTFVALLLGAGLDALLVDTTDKGVISTIYATNALLGKDEWCQEYLSAYRSRRLTL